MTRRQIDAVAWYGLRWAVIGLAFGLAFGGLISGLAGWWLGFVIGAALRTRLDVRRWKRSL